MNLARFLTAIAPDLWNVGKSLYVMFKGDVGRARVVLDIVRDHGDILDRRRIEFDRDLELMRSRKEVT